MAERPDRLAGLPRAPAGVAAVLALALAAPTLGRAGLLVPGADLGAGDRLVLRAAGLAVAAVAVVALARRGDVGLRGVPGTIVAAAAVAATIGLLTLPTSDVALDWPPPGEPAPLPPSPAAPPADAAAPPPPVLRLPAGGQLHVQADELILEFPDGSSYPFGSADGGDGTTPLPAGPALELEVTGDGGLAVTDGAGTVLADLPPGGGSNLDLGDVQIQGDAGNGLVDVAGGSVTDAGGAATGEVEVVPVGPDEGGRDLAATVAGVLLAAAAYWLVFLRGRLTPRRTRTEPALVEAPADVRPDPITARRGLEETLEALLDDADPRTAIVAAYARLLAALERAGLGRRPPEAPHEHLRRVLQPLGVEPEPLHDLAELFVLARFADAPVTEAHRAAAIHALHRATADLDALVPS